MSPAGPQMTPGTPQPEQQKNPAQAVADNIADQAKQVANTNQYTRQPNHPNMHPMQMRPIMPNQMMQVRGPMYISGMPYAPVPYYPGAARPIYMAQRQPVYQVGYPGYRAMPYQQGYMQAQQQPPQGQQQHPQSQPTSQHQQHQQQPQQQQHQQNHQTQSSQPKNQLTQIDYDKLRQDLEHIIGIFNSNIPEDSKNNQIIQVLQGNPHLVVLFIKKKNRQEAVVQNDTAQMLLNKIPASVFELTDHIPKNNQGYQQQGQIQVSLLTSRLEPAQFFTEIFFRITISK